MKHKIRLFAILRDSIGQDTIEIDLPDNAVGTDLLNELSHRYPNLSSVFKSSAIAMDGVYITPSEKIQPNTEIVLIPPVSGGSK